MLTLNGPMLFIFILFINNYFLDVSKPNTININRYNPATTFLALPSFPGYIITF